MRWVNRPHVYRPGNKRPTIPPSLGFWFSQSKHSHQGEDLKTTVRMEGILSSWRRGGETCSGGWGRRTLGLRLLAQQRGCEVKPWTRDEPAPIPSRSLPPMPAEGGSHTHPWGDLGCRGSLLGHRGAGGAVFSLH